MGDVPDSLTLHNPVKPRDSAFSGLEVMPGHPLNNQEDRTPCLQS
jgi:hypothetical protein